MLECLFSLMIDRLGHGQYRQRAAAHSCLAAAGALARPALEGAENHPVPEVRARVAELLGRWEAERLWEQAGRLRPTSWPRTPWLSLNLPPLDGSYLSQARRKASGKGQGAPDWPEYRLATRLWVYAQLRQRRPTAEIVEGLDRMAAEERRWIESQGKLRTPQVRLPEGVTWQRPR
jgi:hypothetical protein